MAIAELLEILKLGVETWNGWREENKDVIVFLTGANLTGANLTGANLTGANLTGANLTGANLTGANLTGANLTGANLTGANLSGANLFDADLHDANLSGANLSDANLSRANLFFADLPGADLHDANLSGANLSDANLPRANLSGANLHDDFLSRADLHGTFLTGVNRHGAFLTGANLTGANLSGVNLSGVNLSRANLSDANLSDANLHGADLHGAFLTRADLSGANLSGADLSGANLSGANFVHSHFIDADLSNCSLGRTIFGLTDLSTCKGLESVKVSAPCVIDFPTLRASKNLPKEFFTKLGIPDLLMEYLPDFYNPALMIYPAFLSHSWGDKEFVRKLYEALTKKGVTVWLDEKKMKPGDNIHDSIAEGIKYYDKLILVCSQNSLNSWWVEKELEKVYEKEREMLKERGEKFRLVIPIRIDDNILNWTDGILTTVRNSLIGDFTKWQDDKEFEKAVKELVDALNANRPNMKPKSFL